MRKDSWQAGNGPLVRFAEGFRNDLLEAGHPPGSLKHYLMLMGQLNRWLVSEGLGVEDLCVAGEASTTLSSPPPHGSTGPTTSRHSELAYRTPAEVEAEYYDFPPRPTAA